MEGFSFFFDSGRGKVTRIVRLSLGACAQNLNISHNEHSFNPILITIFGGKDGI
ncbi:hypothetical protein SAMN04487897_1513 [Paenibacillus sp. yr247]|nr:hypothetical protein SAMN04487897_1513 [Paenibacillus sp. yr247]